MNLKKIKVSKEFRKHKPSKKKVEAAKKYYEKNKKLDKPVVLNHNNEIVDGYARFVAIRELGVSEVDESNFSYEEAEYVFAHHPEDPAKKSYVWRLIRNGHDVLVNDMIPVRCWNKETKRVHNTYVIVDKIEKLDYKPFDDKIRTCIIKGV